MADIDSLAAALFGSKRAETQEVLTDATTRTYTGTAVTDSEDGTVIVDLGGDVTLPDDIEGLAEYSADGVEVATGPGVRAGDEVVVTLVGGTPLKTPMVTGVAGEGDRQDERIHAIEADYVKATTLEADVAEIGFLKADSATIADLQADTAKVHDLTAAQLAAATGYVGELQAGSVSAQDIVAGKATVGELAADHVSVSDLDAATARIGDLEADHVSVSDFQAEQASIDSLQAATADIDTIRANSAKVQNLTAAQLEADHAKVGQLDVDQIAADHATIGTLDTTYASIANLNAANGRITNLESTKANISDLEADYIKADEIEATYMHANMSNSDVAWIENGTIKNGAIVSAMINDVSANKLTAGTINGSVINVTNLNADNITTGTINGQRIGEGSLSLDKLSEDVYTEAEVNNIVDGLNDRIDGAIETFTGTAVPTLNNQPASSWNTTKLRDEHVGDVYYVVNSQSQQNGYCYRFTKSGSTYSWQLIKDSDVTAALSRLTTAEGKITTFDSDISTLKTTTGTLTTKTESLETRMSDAEADILDKVDTTTFNEVSDTVDSHSQSITQMTTTLSNKADSSTVTAVTNRVSKNEQDISGINTTIGELQDTVETKADGSTVSTISNKLNTVSDTVDGHTQTLTSVQNTLSTKADSSTVSTLSTKVNNVSDTVDGHTSQLSSITTTQTTMQGTLDKTVKSSIQLWYSKANTTAPSKPTSKVTSTSTSGNAWRIVVPAYNSSYPHYYYCWQYEYADGTYGWSAVVRDIAMGESQFTARTADSNASAAVTTANTASTNASTALTTANTANTNASDAKTAATTASTTASEAKTTAETAASDASTAKTNAASAVTTANSASTTATNAQNTANTNIKSSVQLWFTKANSTAPNKPTSVVSTSNANTANAWNLVVPVWNSSYPHYYYCYQQQKGDGTYQWTDVVYDRATSEAQQLANTTSTNLSTLQQDYATFKQTTQTFESTIGTTYATKAELQTTDDKIENLEIGGRNLLRNSSVEYSQSSSTATWFEWQITDAPLETSQDYTFSFDAKTSNGTDVFYVGFGNGSGSTQENMATGVKPTTDYRRMSVTARTTKTNISSIIVSSATQYGRGNGSNSGGTLYIKNVKLEKSNHATDWTPAPEDVDAAIDKIDGKTSVRLHLRRDSWTDAQWSAYASVGHADYFSNAHVASGGGTSVTGFDGTTLNVGDLIVIEGISTGTSIPYSATAKVTSVPTSATGMIPATVISANNAKGIETRVTTAETSIEQNANAIALKANSSDVYTKTAVDGKITQEVTNRNAAITAKANEITSTVSQTYTTKEEFENLDIGGRNLALNTAGVIVDRTEMPDGSRYEYFYFDLGRALPFGAGTPIVISFDLYMPIKSSSPRFLVYNTNRKGPHQTLFDIDVLSGKNLPVGSIVDERIVIETSVYADRSDSTLPNDYLEFYSSYGSNNYYRISNLKLEKGNKATDWTPAPEDIEERVSSAESAITQNAQNIELKVSKDGVISSINQSAETVKIKAEKVEIDGTAVFSAISSDVDDAITSKGYQTSSQVNSAITSKGYATTTQAQGYATTAKSEAISAAATDATSKANAAQTAATNAANAATDQKLTSYSTTQQMNEAIQDATGPLFYGRENSSGYIHLGHVSYAVSSANNYSHLHLTGRIGGWASYTSGSIDVTFKSRNDAALYNTVDRRDEAIDTSFVDVLVYTGTDNLTHYWLKVNSYWYAQLYAEFEQFVEDDHTRTTTEPDGTCVWRLSEHTAVAATKSNAVKRTQRIYYRWNSATAPAAPTSWVTKGDDGSALWTKMHVSITESYKYIYTCEQYEMADGTLGHTDVLLDNTITVIDGGNIITGSVTANKLDAANINASKSLTVGAMTDAAASTILNSNVVVGGRNLLRNTGNYATWDANAQQTYITRYDDCIKFTPPSSANWWTIEPHEAYIPLSEWDTSASYTVSIDVKFDNFKSKPQYPRVAMTSVVNNTTIGYTARVNEIGVEIVPTSNDWTHFEWTFDGDYSKWTSPGSGTPAYIKVSVWLHLNSSHADAVSFRNLKLEKGNKATDWTPAPEDITAEKYITSINDNGIRVHAKSNTTTNYAAIDADGLDVVKGGVSVAQFGKTSGTGPSARIGREASTHVTISASETSGTGYTDSTSDMTLYDSTGNSPDLRLYNTSRAWSDDSDGSEEVGIALGRDVYASKIRASIYEGEDPSSNLEILTGDLSTSVNAGTFIGSQRHWASDSSKFDKASVQTTSGAGGGASVQISAMSGNPNAAGAYAGMSVKATSSGTTVTIEADEIKLYDNQQDSYSPAYMTHGVVNSGQSTATPANGYQDFSVTFGHTYTSYPHVVVGFYSTSTAAALGGLSCAVNSITYTGCTIRVFNNTSSARSPAVEWIAIG